MSSNNRSMGSDDLARSHDGETYCPSCDESFGGDVLSCPNDGTKLVRLHEVTDPLIGRNIEDRFVIKSRIGSGGMGAVYLALQGSVGREVAIKVIESRLSSKRIATKRFLREAKLSSRLQQANTVTVLDFGQTEDGLLYLVMELVKGRTLSQVLEQDGPFSVVRMARVGIQLCEALEAAHRLSIIHRDLKPSNVILLDDPPGRDQIKVLDFGLAKSLAGEEESQTMTQSDAIMGTPSYIPPEAVTRMQFDVRSDLYSMGVILYEILTGQLPFQADTVQTMLRQHAYEKPRALPPTVPAAVQGLLLRLLEKDPDRRPQSAGEVRAELQGIIEAAPRSPSITPVPASTSPARRPSLGAGFDTTQFTPLPRLAKSRGRRTLWIVALLALAGAAAAAAVVSREGASRAGEAGEHAAGSAITPPPAPAAAITPADAPRPTPAEATGALSPTPAEVATAPVTPPAEVATAPVTVPVELVALTLTSDPPATVLVDGKALGKSPQVVETPRHQAIEVRFQRAGYKAFAVKLTPDKDDTISRSLELERSGKPARTRPGKSGKAGKPADKPADVERKPTVKWVKPN